MRESSQLRDAVVSPTSRRTALAPAEHGELERSGRRVPPETREAALLQALGVDAQARAVPKQDLGSSARAAREHVEITGEKISPEVVRHERAQPVEPFPHVRGCGIGIHDHLARGADHARPRSTVTTPATSSPSTRKPLGAMTTGLASGAISAIAGASATGRQGQRRQLWRRGLPQ